MFRKFRCWKKGHDWELIEVELDPMYSHLIDLFLKRLQTHTVQTWTHGIKAWYWHCSHCRASKPATATDVAEKNKLEIQR